MLKANYRKKTVNIVYCAQPYYIGGSEIQLNDIIRNINPHKFKLWVLLFDNGPVESFFREKGIRVKVITDKKWINLRRKISCFFRDNEIDLVHTLTPRIFQGAMVARLCGIPHIWHIYASFDTMFPAADKIRKRKALDFIYSLSSRVIVCSKYAYGQFSGLGLRGKVTVLNNGIDLDKYSSVTERRRIALRKVMGFAPKDFLVGTISRFSPEKRIEDFIAAASLVKKRQARAKFICVGQKNKSSYFYKLLAMNKKMGSPVKFINFRDDISKIVASLDLLVSAAVGDALSLVILEAMASGITVVAADSGGSPEMIINGKTGFLVAPKNPRRISELLIKLICDPRKMHNIGVLARKRAEKLFDIRRTARNLENIYFDLATQKQRLASS